MIFQYARRFYVDFDLFVDGVVNCRHDGGVSPALQTREELRSWARRITKTLKSEPGAKVKGRVVRFGRDVQPRSVAHLLNVAMAEDPYTAYDMGVNRLPHARIYILRDGLREPEFGDPYLSTAFGWDAGRDRLEADALRERLVKAATAPTKKRKASSELPPHLQHFLGRSVI